jgi:hypothetical protein
MMKSPFEQLPSIDPVAGDSFAPASADDPMLREILGESTPSTQYPDKVVPIAPHRRRRGLVAGGLTAVLVAALIALPTLSSTTATAFADWTPSPQNISAAQALSYADPCQTESVVEIGPDPAYKSNPDQNVSPVVLTDQRGSHHVTVAFAADGLTDCSAGAGAADYGAIALRHPAPDPAPQLTVMMLGVSDYPGEGLILTLAGNADSTVTKVTAVLSDGTATNAVLQGGHWLLWAPAPANAPDRVWKEVRYTLSDGSTHSTESLPSEDKILGSFNVNAVAKVVENMGSSNGAQNDAMESLGSQNSDLLMSI